MLRAAIQNLGAQPTFPTDLYVSGPLELDTDREHAFGCVHILSGGVLGVRGGSRLCLRVAERLRIDPGGAIDLSGRSDLPRPAKAPVESPPNSMKEKRRGAANGKAAHVPIGGISESVLEPAVGGGEGGLLVHPAEQGGAWQASPRDIDAPGAAGAPQGSCGGKGAVAPQLQAQMLSQQSLSQHPWAQYARPSPGFFICGGDGGGGGGALVVRAGVLDNRGVIRCDGRDGGAGASEAEAAAHNWTRKAAMLARCNYQTPGCTPVILFAGGGGGGGGSVSIAACEVVSRGVISAAGGAGASATLLGKAHVSWSGNVLQVGGYTPAAVETSAALAEAVKAGLSLRLGLAPAGDGEAGVVRVTVSATPAAGVSATPEDTDV